MINILKGCWFISIGSILGLTSGCYGTYRPEPPPKRECITAEECWDIKPSLNEACGWSASNDVNGIDGGARFGRVPPSMADRQFKIYGMHADKDVQVVLETIIESQLPGPPQVFLTPLTLRAKPKGNVMGGKPDGINRGGPDIFLGCEWVRSGDLLLHYKFDVKKACFENDPLCSTAPPYTKPDPRPSVDQELARCENACSSNHPEKCFKYPEISTQPGNNLYKIHRDLVTKNLPFSIDLAPLLSVLAATGTAVCDPRNLEVSEAEVASAFGPACRLALSTPTGTPKNLRSVVLNLPNVISGDFSRAGTNNQALAKIQFRVTNTAAIEFYKPETTIVSLEDPLMAAYFAPNRILLAGKSQFCAVIPYKGG